MKNIVNIVFAVLFTLTTVFFMLVNSIIIIKSIDNIMIAACSCVYINALIAIGFTDVKKTVEWFDPIFNWINKKEDKKYLPFEYNDGGRSNYFENQGKDCGPRAISIATEKDYREVYNELSSLNLKHTSIDEDGTNVQSVRDYLTDNGWKWNKLEKECKLQKDNPNIPKKGRIICMMSDHAVAVVDGVIQDVFQPHGYVYGYYYKKEEA